MAHYDLFSWFYDASIEKHYVEQRIAAADALALSPGLSVLDLPAGTGLSFPALRSGITESGVLIGADRSPGMLARARKKAEKAGWSHVRLVETDVAALSAEHLAAAGGAVDRVHVFLGMSAFPDMQASFDALWAALKPGGRCVLVDVHAEVLGFQGKMVNLTARADITRRFWEPLEAVAAEFSRVELPSKPVHGGQLWLASGVKAG